MKSVLKPGKIDTAKALELRVKKGWSYGEIGDYFGVSAQAVSLCLKRFNEMLVAPAELNAYQEQKAAILESVEMQLLSDLVDTDRRAKASLNNVAYSLTAVASQLRLERGQSTQNIAYLDMSKSLQEIQAQRRQLQEALGDVSDGEPHEQGVTDE